MISILRKSTAGILFAFGLMACAPATQPALVGPDDIPETVALFRTVCLQTLPDFSGFGNAAKSQGLTPFSVRGLKNQSYRVPGKAIGVSLAESEGNEICGVHFSGPSDTTQTWSQFKRETLRQTGGSIRKDVTNDFFEAVNYLRNRSLIAYLVRKRGGQVRHVVMLTKPVAESQIYDFVFE